MLEVLVKRSYFPKGTTGTVMWNSPHSDLIKVEINGIYYLVSSTDVEPVVMHHSV